MNIEKMRKEFEAWSANHDYFGGVEVDIAISGNYSDVDMQHAWESWKASRESLVIELPANRITQDSIMMRLHCRKAIEAAGLKVK